MFKLKFPSYTASDASVQDSFSKVTVTTTSAQVKAGTADLGVEPNSSILSAMASSKGTFTVWTKSSTAPSSLSVDIQYNGSTITTLTSFTAGRSATSGNDTYYSYYATWSTTTSLSSGNAITAKWKTTSESLDTYNAVLSVVATDWGDGLDRTGT